MATVINNPSTETAGGGMGMVLGVLLAIAIIVLFFAYGLPAIRNNGGTTNTTNNSVVPERVDVNVNTPTPAPSGN